MTGDETPLTSIEQCREGMEVRHVSMGTGTITHIVDGAARVCFHGKTPQGNRISDGIYDANWFRLCPTFLYEIRS